MEKTIEQLTFMITTLTDGLHNGIKDYAAGRGIPDPEMVRALTASIESLTKARMVLREEDAAEAKAYAMGRKHEADVWANDPVRRGAGS